MAKRPSIFNDDFYSSRLMEGHKYAGRVTGKDTNRNSGIVLSMLDEQPDGFIIHTVYNDPVAVTMSWSTYQSLTTGSSTVSTESKTDAAKESK